LAGTWSGALPLAHARADLRDLDLQVAQVVRRVAERGVTLTITDKARELIANMG
jgi:hypothetical protein